MTSVSGGLTLALPEGRRVRGCLFQHVRGVPVGLPRQRGPGPQRPGLYGDGRCKLEFATTSGSMVVARG